MDGIKTPARLDQSRVELKDSDTDGELESENDEVEVKSEVKTVKEKIEPIIDDDGFEMVVSTKKSKKSKKLEAQIQAQMDLMDGTQDGINNENMND